MNVKEKFQNKKGFTLVEMLIVVAIIAILIAIAIPIIATTLEKAREAVDDGNWRSAISLGNAYYLTETDATVRTSFKSGTWRFFNINSNKEGYIMASTATTFSGKGYGEGTAIGDVKADLTGAVLAVYIHNPPAGKDEYPVVQAVWVATSTDLSSFDGSSGILYNPATAVNGVGTTLAPVS